MKERKWVNMRYSTRSKGVAIEFTRKMALSTRRKTNNQNRECKTIIQLLFKQGGKQF